VIGGKSSGQSAIKKAAEAAAKLSRPRPVELPSGKWRCQVMVNGKRIDVIEDDPAVVHAKALAVKAGLLEEEKEHKSCLSLSYGCTHFTHSCYVLVCTDT